MQRDVSVSCFVPPHFPSGNLHVAVTQSNDIALHASVPATRVFPALGIVYIVANMYVIVACEELKRAWQEKQDEYVRAVEEISRPSENLQRYWRRRREEAKEEEFFKYGFL